MSVETPRERRGSLLRVHELLALVRVRQFDTSTQGGRSRERYRRAVLTALAAAFAKSVSILTVLVTVPLTLHYLGSERYGLWLTISSLTVFLGFADLGLGNGLMNAVSSAFGRDDRAAARTSVSSAFFMLLGVVVVVLALFAALYVVIPWETVFKVTSPLAIREAGPAVAIFVACFALNLPADVVQRVQMGYQEGFASQLWQALGSVFGLAAVLTAVHLKLGLPFLVLALSGGPLLATTLNAIDQFGRRRPWLRPQWSCASAATARRLLRVGVSFFVLQLAVALAFTSDNLVVAQVLGAEAVPQYAVPMRLFSLLGIALAMALSPLWPAYAEAVVRGDTHWVQRTFRRSLLFSALGIGIPAAILVLVGPWVLTVWVGTAIEPTFWLLLGLGIWATINAVGYSTAMLLNGIGAIWLQAILGVAMGVAALGLKIVFTQRFGVAGTIWATIVAYSLITLLPVLWYSRRRVLALSNVGC
jgi:O-antigen/teichoic acid export membrane protein